jgi:hypothetical protein
LAAGAGAGAACLAGVGAGFAGAPGLGAAAVVPVNPVVAARFSGGAALTTGAGLPGAAVL